MLRLVSLKCEAVLRCVCVGAFVSWGGACAGKLEEKKEVLSKKRKAAKEVETRKEKEEEKEGEEVVEEETEAEVEASSAVGEDVSEEEKEWYDDVSVFRLVERTGVASVHAHGRWTGRHGVCSAHGVDCVPSDAQAGAGNGAVGEYGGGEGADEAAGPPAGLWPEASIPR